jgi:hypothetical protein
MENTMRITVIGTNGDFTAFINIDHVSSVAVIGEVSVITMTNGNIFQTLDTVVEIDE